VPRAEKLAQMAIWTTFNFPLNNSDENMKQKIYELYKKQNVNFGLGHGRSLWGLDKIQGVYKLSEYFAKPYFHKH
jgi:hypothetical protein